MPKVLKKKETAENMGKDMPREAAMMETPNSSGRGVETTIPAKKGRMYFLTKSGKWFSMVSARVFRSQLLEMFLISCSKETRNIPKMK